MFKLVVLLSCCIVLSVESYRCRCGKRYHHGTTSTHTGDSSQAEPRPSTNAAVQSRQIGYINCTRPNEHYECGSACQTECATLGQTCPIVNVRCNDACYCNQGYARDSSGTCIPVSQCR